MTVTLVSAATVPATARGGSSGTLRPLMSQVENGQIPVEFLESAAGPGFGDLFDRLASGQPSPPRLLTEQPSPTHLPLPAREGSDATDSLAAGGNNRTTATQAGRPGSAGGLWGSVQPCWQRLAPPRSAPVILEIQLDAAGKLREAPRILRSPGPVDETRLRAEAAALSALAACLPRNDLSFAGRTHRLEFLPLS